MEEPMYTKWKSLDITDYQNAQKDWRRYSKVESILYEMCRKWPGHKDLSAVQAKVILIGRTLRLASNAGWEGQT